MKDLFITLFSEYRDYFIAIDTVDVIARSTVR
jgi:hypothetical protein